MDIITWIVVGLIAGSLASLVMRGSGFGIVGNMFLGIVGAVVGAWGFRELAVRNPITGLGGTIFVAFVGAVVLLLAIHVVRCASRR
jgi:uncharacterized membrane protein YeaQ/YmgE (transglycosylase-associated protein family)